MPASKKNLTQQFSFGKFVSIFSLQLLLSTYNYTQIHTRMYMYLNS